MKFETLRLMAQDYTDRHKEPQPLPATVDIMAYAYQRICQGEDPWTAQGDFSNAWYGYAKHIRLDLVKDSLIRPALETEATRRWGAFCAASVEYLVSSITNLAHSGSTTPPIYSTVLGGTPNERTIQPCENTRSE